MSSLLTDIPRWVEEAATPTQRGFRRAIHCVLDAIATDERLRQLLCMKGGILMALHYDSPRFTTDVDFSNPSPFTAEAEKEVVALLSQALVNTPERLGYDIDCRLQSHEPDPGRDKTYVNLKMKIGYAEKGTAIHRRLMSGMSPQVISIDYNFCESIPEVEEVEISEDGTLRVYGLPTLVAEKFRSLLQQPSRNRTRRQDVFDLNYLLLNRPALHEEGSKRLVVSDIRTKCADREMKVDIASFDDPQVRELSEKDYQTLETELPGQLPDFNEIFEAVSAYYRGLPWGLETA